MALSEAFIASHIAKWEAVLNNPFRPYRAKWPSRLFHHAPIENAVKILKDGNLRSRLDPNNDREKDIAAAGVIESRIHAHDFVRLYFRPRKPTQWHVEGVRKPGECNYGDQAHAPVLVMMVFDARRVLIREGVQFSDRNMQLGEAIPGSDEEYFSAIPFGKVYHEGGTGGDRSITNHRCAEVLTTSPLPLDETIQWIYCRTTAERETLLHLLGSHRQKWADRVLVSDDLLLFERKFVFVEDVTLNEDGVVFQLSPRADQQPVDVCVRAWNATGTEIVNFRNTETNALPDLLVKRWRVPKNMSDGNYLVEIQLEGHLAFRAHVSLGNNLL